MNRAKRAGLSGQPLCHPLCNLIGQERCLSIPILAEGNKCVLCECCYTFSVTAD